MKLSEITLADVKQNLRIDYNYDDAMIQAIMVSAKDFLAVQTGRTETELDDFPQICYAFYVVCSQMYDVQEYTANTDKINPMVRSIINGVKTAEAYINGESG